MPLGSFVFLHNAVQCLSNQLSDSIGEALTRSYLRYARQSAQLEP